jgi:hypothetical protein
MNDHANQGKSDHPSRLNAIITNNGSCIESSSSGTTTAKETKAILSKEADEVTETSNNGAESIEATNLVPTCSSAISTSSSRDHKCIC